MKAISPSEVELDGFFKRLHLANARRVWRDLITRSEQEQWTYHQLLTVLVMEEIAHRQQTRLARLSHRANFPFLKTVDFTYQSTVRLALLGSALSPDFVTDGRALILAGRPGRGKPISQSPSRIAPFRTASMRSSSRQPSSSTISLPPFAPALSAAFSLAIRIPMC